MITTTDSKKLIKRLEAGDSFDQIVDAAIQECERKSSATNKQLMRSLSEQCPNEHRLNMPAIVIIHRQNSVEQSFS